MLSARGGPLHRTHVIYDEIMGTCVLCIYSVRWKETKTAGTGSVSHDYYYSGNFSIKSKPIYDKEELALNPIGLFITDFSISEEKETK